VARRSTTLGAGVTLVAAFACSGRPVELGATLADNLPGGAANDGGGAGGSSGTNTGATGGTGGTDVFDAGPDALADSAPPVCQPFPVWEFRRQGCELTLPQPWTDLAHPGIFLGVDLLYRSPEGTDQVLGYVWRPEDCEGADHAYYLVEPWDPNRLVLCPDTCSALVADGARFFIGIGCPRTYAALR
jgi:hypothetical protein